ncbi:MAG: GNAT family N-acetyltransferase [Egibacteraceae bacterium]
MSLEVRPVRPTEYDRLGAVTVAAYLAVLGPQLSPRYRRALSDVATRAAHAQILVVVDGSDLVGGVAYLDRPSRLTKFAGPGEAELRFLAVAPWASGRGAGRALVDACLDQASATGKTLLGLFTFPRMAAARALYLRLGFRRAPYRDWHVRPGLYLLSYVRDLGCTGGNTVDAAEKPGFSKMAGAGILAKESPG